MKTQLCCSLRIATLFAFAQTGAAGAQDTPAKFQATAAEFVDSCASCHGDDGKGAGFLTRVFKGVNPGDLTGLAARNDGKFPSDRIFEIIDGRAEVAAHGDRKMPVWGDRYWERATSEYGPHELNAQRARTRILELVFYLQSIQE